MPQVEVVTADAQALIRARLLERTPERTPGLHISDIIADLVVCVPSLAKVLDMEAEARDAMFTLGLGWEDAVLAYVGWGSVQQTVEGIVLSADALDPIEARIHEAKCTWKSMRGFNVLDQWRWMTQVKGYCYGYGCDEASLWALHLNGMYAPPSPVVIEYRLSFSQMELAENWAMLIQHKRTMENRSS